MKLIKVLLLVVVTACIITGCASNQNSEKESDVQTSTETNENAIHEDELSITNHEVSDVEYGSYTVTYKITNNTDHNLIFNYITMREEDKNGDVIDEYDSWNKAAQETKLQPGKSMYYELTFSEEDQIKKIISDSYSWSDENDNSFDGSFSKPYVVNIDY